MLCSQQLISDCYCLSCAVSSSQTWHLCQLWPSTPPEGCTAILGTTQPVMHPNCKQRSCTTSHVRQVLYMPACTLIYTPAFRANILPGLLAAHMSSSWQLHARAQQAFASSCLVDSMYLDHRTGHQYWHQAQTSHAGCEAPVSLPINRPWGVLLTSGTCILLPGLAMPICSHDKSRLCINNNGYNNNSINSGNDNSSDTYSSNTHTGWEGVMRVRCSKGLSISQFHGHFFVRSIDLLSLPQVWDTLTMPCSNLNPDKSVFALVSVCVSVGGSQSHRPWGL